MKLDNKGIALATTLFLSVIALLLVGAAYYLLSSGTNISGSQARYTTALEAAKGVAEYVQNVILINFDDISGEEVDCSSIGCSEYSGKCINLNSNGYNNLGGFNVCAKILDTKYYEDKDMFIYTVEIKSTNPNNTNEKAIIDFVYRVE